MSQVFTVVNDDVLVDAIREAQHKIVYVAPGISQAVALALGKRFHELGRLAITIIVDVDSEVDRLGYGDIEGLKYIKQLSDKNILDLREQLGVRIGVLISDDRTWVYAPTPLLIEAGSRQPEKPNALLIPSAAKAIERACGIAPDTLPFEAQIGKQVVRSEKLDAVEKDLQDCPPKQFDVAHIEQVFTSRLQYVEFKVKNYRLTTKSAPIPTDLLGLLGNSDIQDRWRNTFRMFDGTSEISVQIPVRDEAGKKKKNDQGIYCVRTYNETEITNDRKKIISGYLYRVPGYDVMIFRKRRKAFSKAVEAFEKCLEDYHEELVKKIESSIENTLGKLVSVLFPKLKVRPPARYLKHTDGTIGDDELHELLEWDLRNCFGDVERIGKPDVQVKFKEISYETIIDPGFKTALEQSIIPKPLLMELFTEYDAAPESP